MVALISKGMRKNSVRHLPDLGTDLSDIREEQFVRMACDGLPLGVAFVRAGFKINRRDAPSLLFALPRIQARAQAILDARRTSGVISLSEVTDMLKRVFAGAHSEGEYSAAHNAAFSLARLYGHVTDRATLEVIRRPSRDPDAPSEQALSSWVEALPSGPGPGPLGVAGEASGASFLRVSDAPAGLLGLQPSGPEPQSPNEIKDLASNEPSFQPGQTAGPGPSGPELFNDIKWLAQGPGPTRGRPENGAPSAPVTEAPQPRAHSGLLGSARTTVLGHVVPGPRSPRPPPSPKKKVPPKRRRVPVKKGEKPRLVLPSAKDLFGE